MITSVSDISSRLALDAQSVGQLRLQAKTDPVAGARAAAQQFEALFLNMMLKSMRDATPREGLFDDSNTQLYTSMLDSQLAQSLSKGKGIGLADMLVRQMQAQGVIPLDGAAVAGKPASGKVSRQILPLAVAYAAQSVQTPEGEALPEEALSPVASSVVRRSQGFADAADFVNTLWPEATDAAASLGVPPHFLLGHAALESGWGRREIRDASGNGSHNLFGIKAGANWEGATVETLTTEYVNGVAQKRTERFRAYDSYADCFKDYARLLKTGPRYGALFADNGAQVDAAGFARILQQGGYATDPAYAGKLARVINSGAMRQALAV